MLICMCVLYRQNAAPSCRTVVHTTGAVASVSNATHIDVVDDGPDPPVVDLGGHRQHDAALGALQR